MEEELEKRIEKIEELVKENNEILHSMRRHARLSRLFWILKWVVIVGAALTGYYLLQPYIDATIKTYQILMQNISEISHIGDKIPGIDALLK